MKSIFGFDFVEADNPPKLRAWILDQLAFEGDPGRGTDYAVMAIRDLCSEALKCYAELARHADRQPQLAPNQLHRVRSKVRELIDAITFLRTEALALSFMRNPPRLGKFDPNKQIREAFFDCELRARPEATTKELWACWQKDGKVIREKLVLMDQDGRPHVHDLTDSTLNTQLSAARKRVGHEREKKVTKAR